MTTYAVYPSFMSTRIKYFHTIHVSLSIWSRETLTVTVGAVTIVSKLLDYLYETEVDNLQLLSINLAHVLLVDIVDSLPVKCDKCMCKCKKITTYYTTFSIMK